MGQSMSFKYREATIDDYKALCDLTNSLDQLHRENLPGVFQKFEGPVREQEYIQELLNSENVRLFIAEKDSRVLGYIHIAVKDAPSIPVMKPRRYGIIDSIVVDEAYRNQGVGRKLVERAEKWAQEKGATSIELNVYEFNREARVFYSRVGYSSIMMRMSKQIESDQGHGS